MIVNYLDFLREARSQFTLVATYDFDPLFFERRILTSRAFETAQRIVVFVDDDRYREILNGGRQGALFDRRYFVVPMRCAGGVFHPKLLIGIDAKGCLASIGSNNCTASGTGHNLELISTFKAMSPDEIPTSAAICASIFQQFRRYGQNAGQLAKVLEDEVFKPAVETLPWLEDSHPANGTGLELLSNRPHPLWGQVVDRLRGIEVRKITLCAPFYDPSLSILPRIAAVWPNAEVDVIAQPNYSNLAPSVLSELQIQFPQIKLVSALPSTAGRNLHAKALAFETPEKTFWLTGSANISKAALLGGNQEACLWFSTKNSSQDVFQHEWLALVPTEPADFQEAPVNEPRPEPEPALSLRILSATISDKGELKATVRVPASATGLRLKMKRLGEDQPFFARTVGAVTDEIVLQLEEAQLAQIDRPLVAVLEGQVDDQSLRSKPASVAQLAQLLRDRDGSASAGNRLRRLTETGEGLIEYVDTLNGLDEVIDFLKNVNIRFDDGSAQAGGRLPKWRGRDPFSSDIPESWALGSSEGSLPEVREALWDFIQRHIQTRLLKHATRGNLNGLQNFLDVSRTLSSLLLTWHHRVLAGQRVMPAPYVTTGLQEIVESLIGSRPGEASDQRGFAQAIQMNLRNEEDLVREHFVRYRVAATVTATVEELIAVRGAAQNCSLVDTWSMARRAWVSDWLSIMKLQPPNEGEVQEVGVEFRLAA